MTSRPHACLWVTGMPAATVKCLRLEDGFQLESSEMWRGEGWCVLEPMPNAQSFSLSLSYASFFPPSFSTWSIVFRDRLYCGLDGGELTLVFRVWIMCPTLLNPDSCLNHQDSSHLRTSWKFSVSEAACHLPAWPLIVFLRSPCVIILSGYFPGMAVPSGSLQSECPAGMQWLLL